MLDPQSVHVPETVIDLLDAACVMQAVTGELAVIEAVVYEL